MAARTFDRHDDDPFEPAFGGFTQEPGDLEILPRREGFSGAISLPLLPDLIQIYTVSMANGALTIRCGNDRGTIWFDRGEMVHAVCGETTGEDAVYLLLQWRNGQFSLDPDARSAIRTITSSWENVLMEGCRRLDESAGHAPTDDVLREVAETLNGFRAIAVFESGGALVAQHSRVTGPDLSQVGVELVEMLRRQARVMDALSHPSSLRDCFWILTDQVHLFEPLEGGRVLHLIVDRADVNLPLIRRVIDGLAGRIAKPPDSP